MPIENPINFESLVATFEDTDLLHATQQRDRISSIATRIVTLLSGVDTDVEPPDRPENFIATGGVLSALCSWQAAARAILYRVYRSDTSVSPPQNVEIGSTSALTFNDVNVAPGTYVYSVVGENIDGELGLFSDPFVTTVTAGSGVTPTTPANFDATLSSAAGDAEHLVTLSWDALAAGTVAVRVERAIGAGSTNFVTISNGVTGVEYKDSNVLPLTLYRYRVYGVAADGVESAATAIEEVSIPSGDIIPPPVPENLVITAGDGNIYFTWDPVTADDFKRYQWGIGVTSGTYAQIRDTLDTEQSVVIANGTEYFVAVRSEDTSGNKSEWSTEVSATPTAGGTDTTPPLAPEGVVVTKTGNVVKVTWDISTESDLAGYKVYRSDPPTGSSSGPWQTPVTVGGGLTTLEQTLSVTGTYYYFVTAFDASGNESGRSKIVSVTIDNFGTVPGAGGGVVIPPDGNDGNNSSSLGITAQYNQGSTVHQYIDNSAEQNAALFIPGMRAARTGRDTTYTDGGTVYGPGFWPHPTNKNYWLAYDWNNWDLNHSRGGAAYPPTDYNAPLRMINTQFGASYDNRVGNTRIWSNRRYNVRGSITVDCDWVGRLRSAIGSDGEETGEPPFWFPSQKEHCVYDSQSGSGIYLNNTADHPGGHFIYVAPRFYDNEQYYPDNDDMEKDEIVLVQNCHGHNTDLYGTRAAGAFQFFDNGTPTYPGVIFVRNCTLVQKFPFYFRADYVYLDPDANPQLTNSTFRSFGCMDVTQYDHCERPPKADPYGTEDNPGARINPGFDTATMTHCVKLMVVQNCMIDASRPQRPIITVDGVKDVIFENCLFIVREGGTNQIVINPNGGADISRGCKMVETVTFRNCRNVGGTRLVFRIPTGTGSQTEVRYDNGTGIDTPMWERVYNAETGALTSSAAWNPANAVNPATYINAIDPFAGKDLGGYTIPWGITGVIV